MHNADKPDEVIVTAAISLEDPIGVAVQNVVDGPGSDSIAATNDSARLAPPRYIGTMTRRTRHVLNDRRE